MRGKMLSTAVFGVVASLAPLAPAAITYTDASTSNTTNFDNTAFSPTSDAGRDNTDNLWAGRAGGVTSAGATGGTMFESNGTSGTANNGVENAPELATTITGLTSGSTYNVYAYFYDQTGNNSVEWNLRAGLAAASTTLYTGLIPNILTPLGGETVAPQAVADGGAGHLPSGFVVTQGGSPVVDLYQASIGTAVADGSGNTVVFIDDTASPPATANYRSRYDGVGVELAPEPVSLGLIVIGAAGALARRRRI
jgi:hypothetical protein